MVDYRELEEVSSLKQTVGKTVEEVRDGFESTQIVFEDGTYYSEYTYSGNPRDI